MNWCKNIFWLGFTGQYQRDLEMFDVKTPFSFLTATTEIPNSAHISFELRMSVASPIPIIIFCMQSKCFCCCSVYGLVHCCSRLFSSTHREFLPADTVYRLLIDRLLIGSFADIAWNVIQVPRGNWYAIFVRHKMQSNSIDRPFGIRKYTWHIAKHLPK